MNLSLKSLAKISKLVDQNAYDIDLFKEITEFNWYISVATERELDEVYKFLKEDGKYFNLPVPLQTIFGRIYASTKYNDQPEKARRIAEEFILLYCDPVEKDSVCKAMGI